MLAVCMGPLEKHCSKSRAILWQIHDVKNTANSLCVCHEHKEAKMNIALILIAIKVINVDVCYCSKANIYYIKCLLKG